MDKHETSHESKRRNNRHYDPDKTTSEDESEETSEEKETCGEEYSCDDLPPVNWSLVRNRDGRVAGELFGERGCVETAGIIVLCGICPSAGGFPGSFGGGIDRYNRGRRELQLDGGVNVWYSHRRFHRSRLTLWKTD